MPENPSQNATQNANGNGLVPESEPQSEDQSEHDTVAGSAQTPVPTPVDLFGPLGEDVFVVAVKALSGPYGIGRECYAVAALLVTVVLQVVLVTLLLRAGNGSSPNTIKAADTDFLQMQNSVMQLQLCEMQLALALGAPALVHTLDMTSSLHNCTLLLRSSGRTDTLEYSGAVNQSDCTNNTSMVANVLVYQQLRQRQQTLAMHHGL